MRFAAPKSSRDEASAQVEHHIQTRGQHVHLVHPTVVPGWGHTIGLSTRLGFELILAGAAYYSSDEVLHILSSLGEQLRNAELAPHLVEDLGSFSIGPCDPSWSTHLLARARAHHAQENISARQVVPDARHSTLDTPDLSQPLNAESAPAWRWLVEPWALPVLETARVATSLEILQGARATHIARFEEDTWEAFGTTRPMTTQSALSPSR